MLTRSLVIMSMLATLSQAVAAAGGAQPMKEVDVLRDQGYSVSVITRIYGQLLRFSYPKGFSPVFEDTKGPQYIHESVLQGETLQRWSQMITLTGAQGLARNPQVTPSLFADRMAGAFKQSCATSFGGLNLGSLKLGVYDAVAMVVSCGIGPGRTASETVLIVAIKGESDFYTVQWAERGPASSSPIRLDNALWQGRLRRLMPIKLCAIVPGEAAPYPSCAGAP